jgi:hypothetical protein
VSVLSSKAGEPFSAPSTSPANVVGTPIPFASVASLPGYLTSTDAQHNAVDALARSPSSSSPKVLIDRLLSAVSQADASRREISGDADEASARLVAGEENTPAGASAITCAPGIPQEVAGTANACDAQSFLNRRADPAGAQVTLPEGSQVRTVTARIESEPGSGPVSWRQWLVFLTVVAAEGLTWHGKRSSMRISL